MPSIQVVIAENQKIIADLLRNSGCVICLNKHEIPQIGMQIVEAIDQMDRLIIGSSKVRDGVGAEKVIRYLK